MENLTREQFEERLKVIFNPCSRFSIKDVLHALVMDDQAYLDLYRTCSQQCQARIDFYLTQYDNAADKQTVIGSVTGDLE